MDNPCVRENTKVGEVEKEKKKEDDAERLKILREVLDNPCVRENAKVGEVEKENEKEDNKKLRG